MGMCHRMTLHFEMTDFNRVGFPIEFLIVYKFFFFSVQVAQPIRLRDLN